MSTKNKKVSGRATATTTSRPERVGGFGRLLTAIYGVFAISASARALYQLFAKFSDAPVAYLLSAFAAVVYLMATFALSWRSLRAWQVAYTAVAIEMAGVLLVGTWSYLDPSAFPEPTVWSHFGQGYGFIPAVLPFIGVAWLSRNKP